MLQHRQTNIINGFINGAIGDLQVTLDRYDNTDDQELIDELKSLDGDDLLKFVCEDAQEELKIPDDYDPIDQVTNELSSSLFTEQQLELFYADIQKDARVFFDEIIESFEKEDDIPSTDAEFYEYFCTWIGDYTSIEGGYGWILTL